ncbi:MAG: SDR family oxidoreductase [Atopobiaceae bacterium]|jgi:3-oxoacyl-[acyl-carrier protein] reductase|nr:SDR family oxidoreductase [Atopobiaceae bacterium]MCI1497623.1 SDR family oxidoreductase [Atopobiaceae bacterium]MCI1539331.1 SDR family oxidoreductase [Atopobiaceae bacterium]
MPERRSLPLDHGGRSLKVLITGTSSGIGRAAAELFLERGHEVCGLDIAPATIEHPCYTHLIADVRRRDLLPKDLAPNVIVSNAGVQASEDDIDVNLKGTLNVCETYALKDRKAAPQLEAIVLVGSSSGHTGAEFPAYAASKGGVLAYAKNLAQRVAPQATCNSIDPGGVLTDLNLPVMEDETLWSRIMELTPLKRWATPQEIAEWIYFVAVTNRFMTGQNLLIDGGEAGSFDFVWPDTDF